MDYLPTTPEQAQAMLEAIGVRSVEELFADIPPSVRLRRPLDLPPGLSEAELLAHLRSLASRNLDLDRAPCFMGGGAYDHLIPAAVAAVVSRPEFYTAYTPYQAEITQGILQAIFEFQTIICQLTGLDVANASVYDGASALGEGAIMACAATGRGRLLVADTVHPEYRQVVRTYVEGQGIEVCSVPSRDGQVDLAALADLLNEKVAAVLFQHPNFFGVLEPAPEVVRLAHGAGALAVVSVDPISLGLLAPPGAYGADIATGEGQPLGNPIAFGGPYLGFLAAREQLLRRMPGRIVGETVDRQGRRGFVLTLQAREQHIRRERATSNICTNQALNALAALVYCCLVGPRGLRRAAELSLQKAHYAWQRLQEVAGAQPLWPAPFFKEFALRLPGADVEALNRLLAERGYIGGLPLGRFNPAWRDVALFCVTEARSRQEIDGFVQAVADVLPQACGGSRQ